MAQQVGARRRVAPGNLLLHQVIDDTGILRVNEHGPASGGDRVHDLANLAVAEHQAVLIDHKYFDAAGPARDQLRNILDACPACDAAVQGKIDIRIANGLIVFTLKALQRRDARVGNGEIYYQRRAAKSRRPRDIAKLILRSELAKGQIDMYVSIDEAGHDH